MNDLFSIIILAIVQGLTEWLPISSSGHLVLFTELLNFDGGLAFDVALHFGTLIAVIAYFWRDLIGIAKDVFTLNFNNENGKLLSLLIVASIPAVVLGLLFYDYFKSSFENILFLGIGFVLNAFILMIASFDFSAKREKIGYFDSLLMGIGQAISIFPSISRSGTTVAFGFLRGIKEEKVAKFSFLMSIPVILGANILVGVKDLGKESLNFDLALFLGVIISFVVGILTIHWLMKYVFRNKKNLRWFALYSLLLGIAVLLFLV